ncbi:MAG: hypothetical protein AAGE43_01390 [Pseudomonadota bacterium]
MSELRTPLEIALLNRDAAAAADRLAAGDSPQDLNHLGIPVLYDGLRSNDVNLLQLLKDAGGDWTVPYNPGGFTPLIYASLHCELATVRWLVEQVGQSVTQRTARGIGVMHVSVQRDNPEIARYLYAQGADAFVETAHGESPLLISLKSKHGLVLFRFMLERYAETGRSLAGKILPCLGYIFERQQPDAVDALSALLPFLEQVPSEMEIREFVLRQGSCSATPLRSPAVTLDGALSRALFARVKAERVARSCGSASGAQTWRGFEGL